MGDSRLIILGAANFNSKSFRSSDGFSKAKNQLQSYFCHPNGFAIERGNFLDLFDSELSAIEQLREVKHFLRRGSRQVSRTSITFVCYIGHGFLDQSEKGLFMATRTGGGVHKYAEAIHSKYLLDTIKEVAADKKVVCIFDCCFSASAMAAAMGNDQIEQALGEAAEDLPASGGMILGSSGAEERSYLLEDHSSTLFVQGFYDVLFGNTHQLEYSHLSGHMLREQIVTAVNRRDPDFAPTPHIYDIDQNHGTISTQRIFPIIPNAQETKVNTRNESNIGSMGQDDIVSKDEQLEIFNFVKDIDFCLEAINSCVVHSGLQDSAYLNKVRLKRQDRIIEKIADRRSSDRNPNPNYSLDDVTDIIGLRFIALYRNDKDGLVRDVLRLLTGCMEVYPNALKANRIREVKVYSAKPVEADENQALKRLIEKEFIEASKKKGNLYSLPEVEIIGRKDYSSVHLVADLELTGGGRFVTVEIQVRGVLEDVWATIDHDLRYSRERTKNGFDGEEENESNPYLQNLKSFFDAASDYADLIKLEIDTRTKSKPNSMQPIDGSTDFQESAHELQLDVKLEKLIVDLLLEKEKIDKRRDRVRKNGPQKKSDLILSSIYNEYRELGEKFNELADKSISQGGIIGPDYRKNEASLFAFYSIRMEEAYCRASVFNNQIQMQKAKTIYENLKDIVPDSPLIFLRLAESCSKLGSWDSAIEAYQIANDMFSHLCKQDRKKRGWRLTDKQKKYFKHHLPRLRGFAYWSKSCEENLAGHEKSRYLAEALRITSQGMSDIEEEENRMRYINNVAYYWCELNDCDPTNNALNSVLFESIRKHFQELISASKEEHSHAFQFKDTVVRYGAVFGFQKEAEKMADELFDLCMKENAEAVYGKAVRERALRSVLDLRRSGK